MFLMFMLNIIIGTTCVYFMLLPLYPLNWFLCIGPAVVLMGLTFPPQNQGLQEINFDNLSDSRLLFLVITLIIAVPWSWLMLSAGKMGLI